MYAEAKLAQISETDGTHIAIKSGDELFVSLPNEYRLLEAEVPRSHFSMTGKADSGTSQNSLCVKATRPGFGKIVLRVLRIMSHRQEEKLSLNYTISAS